MFTHGQQITLGQLIDQAKAIQAKPGRHDEDPTVMFDFGNYRPNNGSCYRGSYEEFALNYETDSARRQKEGYTITLSDFIKLLEGEIGAIHSGWKGGDFRMTRDTPVWAAETYGVDSSTAVIGLRDFGYQVIIDTRYEEF